MINDMSLLFISPPTSISLSREMKTSLRKSSIDVSLMCRDHNTYVLRRLVLQHVLADVVLLVDVVLEVYPIFHVMFCTFEYEHIGKVSHSI